MCILSEMLCTSRMKTYIRVFNLGVFFINNSSVVYVNRENRYILKHFHSKRYTKTYLYNLYCKEKLYLGKFNNIAHVGAPMYESNDGEMFILMGYCGVDAIEMINGGRFNDMCWYSYVMQVPLLINALFEHGYTHRDIKPENVVYDDVTCKWTLIDFAYTEPVSNGGITFKGTYPYMAPFMGNGVMLGVFMEHNDPSTVKVCSDYYSYALSALALKGHEHTHNPSDMSTAFDVTPCYSFMKSGDEIMSALSKIVVSCVDTRFGVVSWCGSIDNKGVCVFRDPVDLTLVDQTQVERNVQKCWFEFTSIIEKQKGTNIKNVQI